VPGDRSSIDDIPQRLRQWPTWLLGRLHNEAKREISAGLAAESLTMQDYAVLACVGEFPNLSQQQVCDRIGLDRADMVSIIDRLEQAGSLERERDPADRRRYSLRITPAGRAQLRRADRIIASISDEFLSALSPAEVETLRALALRVLGGHPVTTA
jgi:DNA-binding MarR family transcriptional regulator